MHMTPFARLFALDKAGRSIAAKIAMMAMTTSNSINVKPLRPARPASRVGNQLCLSFIAES